MDETMKISLDKLPIKRLDAIDENGFERFPPEINPDEKQLSLIRRIDFTPLIEKDAKKQKRSKETANSAPPWPWQSLVENLQLARQELSVIMDLIQTVEANDAVTVAVMSKPKQLPNEVLSDLAVSSATKLQCFRHLGKYFKQSAKALEQQVTREARFYGALFRLQRNWKVKRQRLTAPGPGTESFTIDLFDNSLQDSMPSLRPSSLSILRVDHDSAGMLSVVLPPKSYRSINFGFLGGHSIWMPKRSSNIKIAALAEHAQEAMKVVVSDEDVDRGIKEAHLVLRQMHQAIFDEQVFDLVNRVIFHPAPGVNVTGIRENFLQLGIGQETSVFLSLAASEPDQDADQINDAIGELQNGEGGPQLDALHIRGVEKRHDALKKNLLGYPSPVGCQIYLQHILHENVFVKANDKHPLAARPQVTGQTADVSALVGHFCMTLAHRIFARKVLSELEKLVGGVPYLHLLSHPTWHSRSSSWSLSVKIPESVLHAGHQSRSPTMHDPKNRPRLQFLTQVVVNDECINVSGEGAPNVVGVFRAKSSDISQMNCYDCDLADFPVVLLQQVASQVIHWLHEEATMVGMKATKDFLSLSLELDQGDLLGLVAHVDPDDVFGCISWWLVMDDGLEEGNLHMDSSNGGSESRRFLGHLSLEALYSTLMDLVSLCSCGSH